MTAPGRSSRTGDHPRVGGEKYDCTGQEFTNWGSPPRGRGKVTVNQMRMLKARITPAWAGKRAVDTVSRCAHWDHPRIGGEKIDSLPHRALYLGSPPCRRGKEVKALHLFLNPGITPAWAGKSRRCCLPGSPRRDHPRVGGEKLSGATIITALEGSPPRRRGKDE